MSTTTTPTTPTPAPNEGNDAPQIPKTIEPPVTVSSIATITETKSSITTTTALPTVITTVVNKTAADSSNNSNTQTGSTNVLIAALLGTIGLIIILSGLLIIVFWLRRGEKSKERNRGLTQLNDDELAGDINDPVNDEMATYRPSDPDDEQLPSYAEAVVRGRSSIITQ